MDNKFIKRIRRFKMAFAVLMGLDLGIIILFSIIRFKDNLWPNQEIWVDETNKKVVMSQAEDWQLPTEEITRVVMVPGLGDEEFKVYYKDGSMKTTGVLRSGDVSSEMVRLVEEYGENEGSRSARKIYFALSAVFFLALLSEVITFRIERCRNERRYRI